VARTEYTDLFTCEWITPNQPCISPFLPVYIGINELPKALGTTEAYELFEKLRALMDYHPEYRDDITQHWTGFEIRTFEESTLAEAKAAKMVDGGDKNEARSILTEFVARKCNEAMATCQKMLDFLNDLPILEKKLPKES
jgi:dipeptidase